MATPIPQQNPQQQHGRQMQQQRRDPFLHLRLSKPDKEPNRDAYRVRLEAWLSRWTDPIIPQVRIKLDGVSWQGQDFYRLDSQKTLSLPLTGLMPGAHILVVVTEDGRHANIQSFDIPAPKEETPEEKELKRVRHQLEVVKVEKELRDAKKPDTDFIRAERASNLAGVQAKQAQAEAVAISARAQMAKAEKEIQNTTAQPDPEVVGAERVSKLAAIRLEEAQTTRKLEELRKQPNSKEGELEERKLEFQLAELNKKLADLAKVPDPELAAAQQKLELTKLQHQQAQEEKKFADLTRGEPPKAAFKIITYEGGSGDERNLTICIQASDKSPVQGATVRVYDRAILPKGYADLSPTNAKGITEYVVQLTTKEKFVNLVVLGTDVSSWLNLFKD